MMPRFWLPFRTNDAVDEACTFTGEGTSDVEGLMCSARIDDVGKTFRTSETKWETQFSGCTYLHRRTLTVGFMPTKSTPTKSTPTKSTLMRSTPTRSTSHEINSHESTPTRSTPNESC